MYKIVAIISAYIRLFYMPNPFEQLPHPVMWPLGDISIPLPPTLLNLFFNGLIGSVILHELAYGITGLYYTKGLDSPEVGSGLYLLFYFVHTLLLGAMAKFSFHAGAVIGILIVYASAHILLSIFRHWIHSRIL